MKVNEKQIRLNVNMFFTVPANYKVTDTESIEFLGDIKLRLGSDEEGIPEDGMVFTPDEIYHETIVTDEIESEDDEPTKVTDQNVMVDP